jgi:hypothetical protein
MALVITATELIKIKIIGTAIELPNIYGRVSFEANPAGTHINYKITPFVDKTFSQTGSPISIDLDITPKTIQLQTGEEQNLTVAHNYAKSYYEGLGYTVNIVDLE